MINTLVLYCAILGLAHAPAPTSAAPANLKAYETARSQMGGDASAQVRMALWCEAHGLTRQRLEHLAQAVALDPRNALARGLMGLVNFGGRWVRPEDAQQRAQT